MCHGSNGLILAGGKTPWFIIFRRWSVGIDRPEASATKEKLVSFAVVPKCEAPFT